MSDPRTDSRTATDMQPLALHVVDATEVAP